MSATDSKSGAPDRPVTPIEHLSGPGGYWDSEDERDDEEFAALPPSHPTLVPHVFNQLAEMNKKIEQLTALVRYSHINPSCCHFDLIDFGAGCEPAGEGR
jgi:hypothetical protein